MTSHMCRVRLSVPFFIAFCLSTLCASAADAPVVTAKFNVATLTPELVRLVARHGELEEMHLSAGADVLDEVTKRCGKPNSSGHYLLLLASANPHLKDLATTNYVLLEPTRIVFPACAYVSEKLGSVTIRPSGPDWSKRLDRLDLHKLQNFKFGMAYAKTLDLDRTFVGRGSSGKFGSGQLKDRDVRKSVDRVMGLGSLQDYTALVSRPPTELAFGREESLELRRATNTQSVLLANDSVGGIASVKLTDILAAPADVPLELSFAIPANTDIEDIVAELGKVDPAAKAVFTTVEPMTAVASEGGEECTATEGDIDSTRWPVAIDSLEEILRLVHAASITDGTGVDAPGRVLVADSGLPELPAEGAFIERRLSPDRSATPPESRRVWSLSRSYNGAADYVTFAEGSAKSGHGLSVLSLASGAVGPALTTIFDRLGVVDRTVVAANIYFVSGAELRSNDNSLTASIDIAKWRSLSIDIVNYSLTYTSSGSPDAFALWELAPEILFVFAAGNESAGGRDVNSGNVYPANLGGLEVPNVITVAASEPSGNLAPFSNYSAKRVDIAAPGCRVPTYDWDAATRQMKSARLSGTSFAAPLVSLTASLLRQQRIGSASAIKRRIISSGDFKKSLQDTIASARILNIPKALSTRFDYLESITGELLFGRVTSFRQEELLCNRMMERTKIFSITFESGVSEVQIAIPGRRVGAVDFIHCSLNSTELRGVVFQRAAIAADGSVVFEPPQTVERAKLRHLGLCEPTRCVDLAESY